MTNAKVIKKAKQYSRRQMKVLTPAMYEEVKKQFFAMLPQMSFKERLKLAGRILRAKSISPEQEKGKKEIAQHPALPEQPPEGDAPPPPPVPKGH